MSSDAETGGTFSLDLSAGPARDARLGARVRRGRHPAGRRRMGRARGNAVADHRGGGQDRALLARLLRPAVRSSRAASASSVAFEELFWGDAGIGLSLVGSGLAAVSVASNGTPEQIGEWLPQMFGSPGDIKLGAFCSSEPDAGSDVGAIRTRAVYDEATDEWVLNGTKTWATNGGIADVHVVVASVDPPLGSRGQASFIVPPGTRGLSQGQKFRKHGIRASHTAEVVLDDVRVPGRCLVGGKERLDARLARVREGGRGGEQAAMKTFEASRPERGRDGRRAWPGRRWSTPPSTPATASSSAGRSARTRASRSCSPTCRRSVDAARLLTWRAAWMARTGTPFEPRRGLDLQAGRGGDRGPGHRAGHPDPGRQRLHPRVPGRALAPRRQDLHHLRGHLRDPAHDHRPGRHRVWTFDSADLQKLAASPAEQVSRPNTQGLTCRNSIGARLIPGRNKARPPRTGPSGNTG